MKQPTQIRSLEKQTLIVPTKEPKSMQCNPKLFSDDTSLFSTAKVPKRTANKMWFKLLRCRF